MVPATALLDQSVSEHPALLFSAPGHLQCLVLLSLRPRLWLGSPATESIQELHVRRIGPEARASSVHTGAGELAVYLVRPLDSRACPRSDG